MKNCKDIKEFTMSHWYCVMIQHFAIKGHRKDCFKNQSIDAHVRYQGSLKLDLSDSRLLDKGYHSSDVY